MLGLDLFAGAGGMSAGATQAGVQVAFAVESEEHAASAYKKNHPQCHVFQEDLRSLSAGALCHIANSSRDLVVFGGPPCQGFSYSNSRTRRVDNKANYLFEDFLRVVSVIRPNFFVFENVIGFTNTAHGYFLKRIFRQFSNLKYSITSGVLNAHDFGVPQRRRRFFMLGSLQKTSLSLPRPTINKSKPTVRDAISDLPRLTNGADISWLPYPDKTSSEYAQKLRGDQIGCANHLVTSNNALILKRYAHIKPGENWQSIPEILMTNYKDRSRCHTGIYHRLSFDEPSIVIGNFRKNMLIHPQEDRGLSVREAARLQSFPDSYEFVGSIGYQQQQVGNAVPPLLAQAVFQQIMEL